MFHARFHAKVLRFLLLSLLPLSFGSPVDDQATLELPVSRKSIAIVGAGSAGLAALKTLLDLPHEVRQGWDLTLFEQRWSVGGIWLPDPNQPKPPQLPETPLYPYLRTNTPVPTMTYPGSPFRPFTPLYPNHRYVWQYHEDYAENFNLNEHIVFNATVINSSWIGDSKKGKWNITVRPQSGDTRSNLFFDHLIVASGHNHYPHVPKWPGEDKWSGESGKFLQNREILHSIFWRNGTKYANRTILVVGGNASGRDAILYTSPYARKVYLSLREANSFPRRLPVSNVTVKPEISHFNASHVVFVDGSAADDIDAIILATGYELRIPFLTHGNEVQVDEQAHSCPENPYTLTTNLRYLFPLHEHIFSLAAAYPPTALAFVGLPILVANCPSDIAQAMFVAQGIAHPEILPSREDMLRELREKESKMSRVGLDPYRVGHRLVDYDTPSDGSVPDMAHDYQDSLVDFLKEKGVIPDDGKPFVEPWRRETRNQSEYLWNAWARIERLGPDEQRKWLTNVETEEQWADLMFRLIDWEKSQVKK